MARGADLLESTPRQLHLAALLGIPAPSHAHVPLVLGPDGARLAKRHGAVTLGDRREAPEQIVGRMAASLGMAEPGEALTPEALLERFHAKTLATEPTIFPDDAEPALD